MIPDQPYRFIFIFFFFCVADFVAYIKESLCSCRKGCGHVSGKKQFFFGRKPPTSIVFFCFLFFEKQNVAWDFRSPYRRVHPSALSCECVCVCVRVRAVMHMCVCNMDNLLSEADWLGLCRSGVFIPGGNGFVLFCFFLFFFVKG